MDHFNLIHKDNFSYIENVFSTAEVEDLIKYWNNLKLGDVLIDGKSDSWNKFLKTKTSIDIPVRKVEIQGIPLSSFKFLTNKIYSLFNLVIDYPYNIEGPHYITSYTEGSFHGKHTDFGVYHGVLRQKVMSIHLTDDYEGGDLIIKGEVAPKGVGTVVLYNGNDMHEVTEVTKGHRLSITECAGSPIEN